MVTLASEWSEICTGKIPCRILKHLPFPCQYDSFMSYVSISRCKTELHVLLLKTVIILQQWAATCLHTGNILWDFTIYMLRLQYFQFNIYHNYSHKVGRTTVQLLHLQLYEVRQLYGEWLGNANSDHIGSAVSDWVLKANNSFTHFICQQYVQQQILLPHSYLPSTFRNQ